MVEWSSLCKEQRRRLLIFLSGSVCVWRGLLKCLGLGKGKLGRSKTRPISNDASNEGSFGLSLKGGTR